MLGKITELSDPGNDDDVWPCLDLTAGDCRARMSDDRAQTVNGELKRHTKDLTSEVGELKKSIADIKSVMSNLAVSNQIILG